MCNNGLQTYTIREKGFTYTYECADENAAVWLWIHFTFVAGTKVHGKPWMGQFSVKCPDGTIVHATIE